MKLFHISDLHLGKKLNEFSMIVDQEYILRQILEIIAEEKPNGILIAGDVYDKTIPSEEAMRLWDDFLIRLAAMKVPVFAISGNHDSAIRFSNHGKLVDSTGIHLSPVYDGEAKCFTLRDGDVTVNIHMLPFVKPVTVRGIFADEEINDYTDACRVAISHMDLDKSDKSCKSAKNILIAHQFVTGAVRCDSEEVSVGGLDNVDASVFDDFDYVALGHIHGKQKIGRETVRYSGTPLKYSFSEKDHKKSITVVTVEAEGVSVSEIPLKPLHDLREIRGTFYELAYGQNSGNTNTDDYIHAILTEDYDVPNALGILRNRYPNLMKLSYDNARTREQRDVDGAVDVEKKTPLELFEEFYEMQNNAPMSKEQRDFVIKCIESVWEDNS
ncbi:MAG: exonuclease SbcCD subunit D [Methanomicrobium sp.]|nr:exonuclease SbcCD subunit D [Methanomicrobium sp.]